MACSGVLASHLIVHFSCITEEQVKLRSFKGKEMTWLVTHQVGCLDILLQIHVDT